MGVHVGPRKSRRHTQKRDSAVRDFRRFALSRSGEKIIFHASRAATGARPRARAHERKTQHPATLGSWRGAV
jgi:hypothetical protein